MDLTNNMAIDYMILSAKEIGLCEEVIEELKTNMESFMEEDEECIEEEYIYEEHIEHEKNEEETSVICDVAIGFKNFIRFILIVLSLPAYASLFLSEHGDYDQSTFYDEKKGIPFLFVVQVFIVMWVSFFFIYLIIQNWGTPIDY